MTQRRRRIRAHPGRRRAASLARKVVVAIGVEHFAYVPEPLSGLPSAAVHAQLRARRTWRRSAARRSWWSAPASPRWSRPRCCTRTARSVQVLARERPWPGTALPLAPDRPLLPAAEGTRVRARLGLGHLVLLQPPGPVPAPAANAPGCTGRGPRWARRARAGSRPRVEGQFPVLPGHAVASAARQQDGRVRLTVAGRDPAGLAADHVIAATGYRTDLTPAAASCRTTLRSTAADRGREPGGRAATISPRSPGCTSSGPRWHPTMGPVMRFVFGTWHAAPAVARQLAADPGHRSSPAMAARPLCSRTPSVTWPSRAPAPASHAPGPDGPWRSGRWRCRPPTRPRWWPRPRSAGSAAAVGEPARRALHRGGPGPARGGPAAPAADLPARVRPGRPHPGRDRRPGAGPARLAARGRRARAGGVVGRAGHRLPRPAARGVARRPPPWPGSTEPAVIIGTGTFGCLPRRADAAASRARPAAGGPARRRPAPAGPVGAVAGPPGRPAEVVRRLGIRRVIVCFSSAIATRTSSR